MSLAEHHPVPHRLYHWVNLIAMLVLIVTGFYIHRPFAEGWMNVARWFHFIFMYVILLNLIARIYIAFFGKKPDYQEFGYGKKDIPDFIATAKYYLFIGPHADTGKYNPLQKTSYNAAILLIFLQGLTGFAMYYPVQFAGFLDALGGLAAVRALHYLLMWVFIAFTLFHAYLAASVWPEFMIMMFGIEKKEEGMVASGKSADLGGR